MRKLLNTLYVVSGNAYLSLKGETIEILYDDGTKKQLPFVTIESIVSFSYKGASPALMGKCAENRIGFHFFTPQGRYLASVSSQENGNVLLRREQYRIADDEQRKLCYVKALLAGKLYNSKYVLQRCVRDHGLTVNENALKKASGEITKYMSDIQAVSSIDSCRGIEGNAAAEYFSVFNELILQNKDEFCFNGRNRRPPTDRINAMLSFAYSLLANDCVNALRSVGLDPFVGFLHTDRSGRKSLALDIMEELRSVFADRFVLTLVNNRVLCPKDFEIQATGAVILTESARKTFITEWQKKKKEILTHPFLGEKMPWGLVPYVQALLLARTIRGDLDNYPPFFWK